jgi:PAS domain S-box-containing protein
MDRQKNREQQKNGNRHPATGLQKFFDHDGGGKGLSLVRKLTGVVEREWFERETIRAIEEISSDAIFIAGMDKRILECSASAPGVFGYEKGELIGMDAARLLCNKDNSQLMQMQQSGIIGKAACTYERKDGSSFPGEFSGKIIRDGGGKPSFMVIAVWDTTEREMNLMKQKAESVTIVAGGIAHDINNMMTSVIGYMELARINAKKADELQHKGALEYINSAMDMAVEIRALIQRFNTISGFSVARDEPVSLDSLMPHLEFKLKDMAAAKKAVLHFTAGSDCTILGDNMKMIELLEILAVNAIESLPGAGGEVSITARREANKVTVTVSDNGKGIDDKIIGKIFDPYFSTKDRGSQRGMGLSLAVAHSLVMLFKGDIGVQSRKGEETTFTMNFPAADAHI